MLGFCSDPAHDMLVACLWSFDERANPYSFAAITDAPPSKIAAAGHARGIVPIKRETWTDPAATPFLGCMRSWTTMIGHLTSIA